MLLAETFRLQQRLVSALTSPVAFISEGVAGMVAGEAFFAQEGLLFGVHLAVEALVD